MAEPTEDQWLVEEGIGEHRAILVSGGRIIAAQVDWPGSLAVGRIDDAVLVARIVDVVKASGVDGINLRGLRSTVRLKIKATNTVIGTARSMGVTITE